jgi:hypothetical protein
MLIAEASVPTERASRYLVQLCQHISLVAQANPHMQAHAEWSDDQGVISFGDGRCVLRAGPQALTLRAEASDEQTLGRLQERIAGRVEQVGRRDGLTVSWRPAERTAE